MYALYNTYNKQTSPLLICRVILTVIPLLGGYKPRNCINYNLCGYLYKFCILL